jgi:hypothetical protein
MVKRRSWLGIATLGIGAIGATWVSAGPVLAVVRPFRYEHAEPLNNLSLTPGAVFNVSVAAICKTGYSSRVRDVPESEKLAVYAEYSITNHPTNRYEIDHLISLELGGSNAISNLWPELNDHPKGYLNSKDRLEDHLHRLVCTGQLALGVAQRLIATDWVSAYHRYFAVWPSGTTATSSASPTSTSTTVIAATTGGVIIVSVVSPISVGGDEHLVVHSTRPNDACGLSVALPSGAKSTASGLGTTQASATGLATWTWRIGTSTHSGVAQALVRCSAGSLTTSFVIA